jgi:hypothetical protein
MPERSWSYAPGTHQDNGKQSIEMVNNPQAILPGLQNDVARLITILLISEQQTLVLVADIDHYRPHEIQFHSLLAEYH